MAKAKPLKTPKQLGLTPEQYKNLAKLIIFVKDRVAPPKFNMYVYYHSTRMRGERGQANSVVGNPKYGCGTTACFCGYGPLAGIKPHKNEVWSEYGARVFGAGSTDDYKNQSIWYMLFSAGHVDDKMAAVKRGAWLLQHGLPSTKYNLSGWEVPHSFRPRYAAIRKVQ